MTIRPEAEADLEAARDWYERQRPGLGHEFGTEVDAAIQRLMRMPAALAPVHREFRRFFVRRFPFAIYYLLDENEIVIFAVLHMRRDSSAWKKRIE